MEYVSSVLLDINGQAITDFKTFKEGEREIRKQIKLMKKTGHLKTTPALTFSVDYVIPADDSEFDFDAVDGSGRVTIEYENGKRVTFTGVACLKIGETTYDDENEATRTIEFGATGRIVE